MLRLAPLAWLLALSISSAHAAAPRALPEGQRPDDPRLGPLKSLHGYFPFTPPESKEAWAARREAVRRQVQLAMGLWPLPPATPLEAQVHSPVDGGDYIVEAVVFQSYPGHYVSGSLYRPKEMSEGARLPAVLCPHGHWPQGRFYDNGPDGVRQQIALGAERFEEGGRSPLQARCMQLARMGCVALLYDMIGYADSQQMEHRPGIRDEMNTAERWGFFSPQAELRMQNMIGVQTYNSVRALDFITSLPYVDAQRIAVTGASGGGTQTLILSAIDERVTVSVPCVMVSTAMQGGCPCENACYLRVGSGNIELAGLFAPKPLAMTAADDWTIELETKGLPELRQLYALLGAPGNVEANLRTFFKHNYNYPNRAFVYRFLNRHFKLRLPEPIVEEDYQRLTPEQATVWNESHPRPAGGPDEERRLVETMTGIAQEQMRQLAPHDSASLAEYRRVVGGAWDVLLGRRYDNAGPVEYEMLAKEDRGDYFEFTSLLRNTAAKEELPTVFLHPKNWNGEVVIWIDPAGKDGLYTAAGELSEASHRLLDEGYSIAGVDLLYQGEFLADGKPLIAQPMVNGGRDAWTNYAGFTYGYNYPLWVKRVHDILSVVWYVRHDEHGARRVHLAGMNGAGALVLAAAVQAGDAVDCVVADTAGFSFQQLDRLDHPDFVPGAVKYGDVPTLIALAAPHPVLLSGEAEVPPAAVQCYKLENAAEAIHSSGEQSPAIDVVIDWLSQQSTR